MDTLDSVFSDLIRSLLSRDKEQRRSSQRQQELPQLLTHLLYQLQTSSDPQTRSRLLSQLLKLTDKHQLQALTNQQHGTCVYGLLPLLPLLPLPLLQSLRFIVHTVAIHIITTLLPPPPPPSYKDPNKTLYITCSLLAFSMLLAIVMSAAVIYTHMSLVSSNAYNLI